MTQRKCCASCFGDLHLAKVIVPTLQPTNGDCSYCRSENQQLIEPKLLRDYFDLFLTPYSVSAQGDLLVDLLKSDWAMFSSTEMDMANAKELLAEILDDGEIVRKKFVSAYTQHSGDEEWNELRAELMHENRYFPNTKFDVNQLAKFFPHLIVGEDELTGPFFRARIEDENGTIPLDQMGAPPKERASHGRANPVGIPYLYLASTETTAAAEVRPHTGEQISVAEFNLDDNLRIVNLISPRVTLSPFKIDDENELRLFRDGIGLLERLGEELTRPVLPRTAAFHYIPSQFLCEFVKSQGFDGVMYSSSMDEGINVALFDPTNVKAVSVKSLTIESVIIALAI